MCGGDNWELRRIADRAGRYKQCRYICSVLNSYPSFVLHEKKILPFALLMWFLHAMETDELPSKYKYLSINSEVYLLVYPKAARVMPCVMPWLLSFNQMEKRKQKPSMNFWFVYVVYSLPNRLLNILKTFV